MPPGGRDTRRKVIQSRFLHNWTCPDVRVVWLATSCCLMSSLPASGLNLRARCVLHSTLQGLRVALNAQFIMRAASNGFPMPSILTSITFLLVIVSFGPAWASSVHLLHGNGHGNVPLSLFCNGDGDGGNNNQAIQKATEPKLHLVRDLMWRRRKGSSAKKYLFAT